MQFGRSCQIKKISAEACGNICPWRNWITQQIPILEIGGSNPFGQATVKMGVRKHSHFYCACTESEGI